MMAIVCEDDAEQRAWYREYLESAGYMVKEAASAAEYEDVVMDAQGDLLVIMDLNLGVHGDLEGLELTEFTTGLFVDAVVIVATGESRKLEAKKKGAHDVLIKPVDGRQLSEAIRMAIAEHEDIHQQAVNKVMSHPEFYKIVQEFELGHQLPEDMATTDKGRMSKVLQGFFRNTKVGEAALDDLLQMWVRGDVAFPYAVRDLMALDAGTYSGRERNLRGRSGQTLEIRTGRGDTHRAYYRRRGAVIHLLRVTPKPLQKETLRWIDSQSS